MNFHSLINSRHRGEKLPLYVFFGQSNMAGLGVLSDIPSSELGVIQNAKVWNSNTSSFDNMEIGVNSGNTTYYSAIARFAYLKQLEDPSVVNYYFIDAVNGTSMQIKWRADSISTQVNLDTFDEIQSTGRFECKEIYWMQGEADSGVLQDATEYQGLEADMIDLYKSYYECDSFITCLLGVDVSIATAFPYVSTVNNGKTTNFNSNKATDLLYTVDIPKNDDGVHFTSLGLRELGNRMYSTHGKMSIPDDTPFEFTMRTTTNSEQIELPITVDGIGKINWGDGSPLEDAKEVNRFHTYTNSGDYVVTISSIGHRFYFFTYGSSKTKIVDISKWGINGWNHLNGLSLFGCSNMDISATDISQINNTNKALNSLFSGCSSLVWNSSVGDITVESSSYNGTFTNTPLFNYQITNWSGVASVVNKSMFSGSGYNKHVDNLVKPITINVDSMFLNNIVFNQDIVGWDSSNVSLWSNFMSNAQAFEKDLSHLDFSSATTLYRFMFLKSSYPPAFYDALLINWDANLVFSNFTDVNITMGTIQHTAAGAAARASLVSKGFVVSDGGQV